MDDSRSRRPVSASFRAALARQHRMLASVNACLCYASAPIDAACGPYGCEVDEPSWSGSADSARRYREGNEEAVTSARQDVRGGHDRPLVIPAISCDFDISHRS